MQHYTFAFDRAVDGVSYRFSNELGEKLGVSRDGMVVSSTHRTRGYRGTPRGNGYFGITVSGHTVYIHRIVYELYSGTTIPNGMCIDHVDGTRGNNSFDNLRVATNSENIRNPISYRNSLSTYRRNMEKAVDARRRPVIAVDRSGSTTWFKSLRDAARSCRTSAMNIHSAIRRNGMSAGFKWRYA